MSFLLSMVASGVFYSAGDLKRDCTAPSGIETCFAYLGAVRDTSDAYQQWMSFHEYCPPQAGLSKADLRDAIMRYLDLHTGNGDAQAASIIILALKERYPCNRTEFPKLAPDSGPTPTPVAPGVTSRNSASSSP